MADATVRSQSRVIEFDQRALDAAGRQLFRRAASDGRPDLVIGIPTGGMFVAEAVVAAGGAIPLLPLTWRRPSTRHKRRAAALRRLITRLPRPVRDRARLIEHAVLTARRRRDGGPPGREFNEAELAALRAWLATAGARPSLLVVDDAVDSGVTLSLVIDAIRRLAPPGADIRSAAITVTTERPLVWPTYALHHGPLCRFPWSFDAPTPTPY